MIKLTNIVKSYNIEDKEFHALDGVDLNINEGEMVAIMGPSGSGKSTMLNIIGGMDTATSGEYMFNDIEVSKLGNVELHKFRKNNVSFVFQQFALMNKHTVFENVEMPLIAKKINRKKRKETVMEKLEMLNIADQAKKLPTHLSGGQQQRCAIARALASDNKLILADEPTGALDSSTGEEILNIFKSINEMGKTVIVITHDINVASKCQRIISHEDGKIK